MAILTRLTSRHLDDAAFAEIWTNAAAEARDLRHPHLDECAECRVRFGSFAEWMDGLRLDGVAEADQAFPPERLKAQQAQILRRIEAVDEPTRIIAFPKAPLSARRSSPLYKWVAGSAAAGLLVGIVLGQMVDIGRLPDRRPLVAPTRLADARTTSPTVGLVPVAATFNEETAMAELEAAATPRYEALQAYDTFTPRAADFIQPR